MLRAHKVALLELRIKLGLGTIKSETWVFSTVNGELLSPDNLSRDWRRVSAAKNLPQVSFHALRHTNASVLISKGVDILTISRRLGHSKPSVTLDVYGHLIEGSDTAAAQALTGVLGTPRER
jgi:integrase